MAGENTVKFKSKKPVDNLSKRCCWCYEVHLDEDIAIQYVGLDIDEEIPTFDPEGYTECNDYAVATRTETTQSVPKGKKMIGTPIDANQDNIEICFISTCAESDEDKPISLHYNDEDGWSPLEIISGNVPQPAVAMSSTPEHELVDLLAYYEGTKSAHLLSKASFSGHKPAVLVDPDKPHDSSQREFEDLK